MAGFMSALHTPSGARRCFAFGAQPLAGLAPMPSALNRKNTYCPATWARLANTSTLATMIAQPAHPDLEQHRDEREHGDGRRLRSDRRDELELELLLDRLLQRRFHPPGRGHAHSCWQFSPAGRESDRA